MSDVKNLGRKITFTKEHRRISNKWRKMKSRCYDPTDQAYVNYGGRGIGVCQGWLSSWKSYYEDIGDKPFPTATIDRIDNDGGYWCGHCDECIENGWPKNWRWATKAEQVDNRRPFKHAYHPLRGISNYKDKFKAIIVVDSKLVYLGMFDTLEEAQAAYLDALVKWEEQNGLR